MRDSETYKAERSALAAAYRDGEKSYDQWLLTMASGGLGLSMGFIKDIAHPPVVSPSLLICAWIGLGLPIVLLLINLRVAAAMHWKFVRILDRHFSPSRYEPDKEMWQAVRDEQEQATYKSKLGPIKITVKGHTLMDILNDTSLISFVVGVMLLGAFIYRNLH